MYQPGGTCSLVAGPIDRDDVCDRWQARSRSINWDRLEQRDPPTPAMVKAAVKAVKAMPVDDDGKVPTLFPVYPGDVPDVPDSAWQQAKSKTIKFDKLSASQPALTQDDLIWHINNPGQTKYPEQPINIQPQVVKMGDGARVIVNGHHRLCGEKLLGLTKDLCWVVKEKDLPA